MKNSYLTLTLCLCLGSLLNIQAQPIQCTQNADYVVDYGDGYTYLIGINGGTTITDKTIAIRQLYTPGQLTPNPCA